jgi:flagellar biosynthesis chaperone FliJ
MFVLSVNGVKPESEIETVKTALKKERLSRETNEKALKAFGEYTPEKIATMVEELNALKSAKNSATEEDFLKRLNESKDSYTKELEKRQTEWEGKEREYQATINAREQDLLDMKLENRFYALFSEKGDPSGRSLGYQRAKMDLVWNAEQDDFYTKDGLVSIKEWMDGTLFKEHACLLKPSLSGGARGGDSTAVSYEKYFNPASSVYSDDPNSDAYKKRLEYFRKDPEGAKALLAKYKK